MDLFDTDSILDADPPGMPILHDREYRVRAYRKAEDRIVIRGAVRDQKPPGLYLVDDPEPLTIHHMQVDIEIVFPTLEIVDAGVLFETHPMTGCPTIAEHYRQLIGLSIARGFTHKMRELFGGPRGCTHTTALLQAMAPVAMQCFWSMRAASAREQGIDGGVTPRGDDDSWRMNIGTCHMWADDGEHDRCQTPIVTAATGRCALCSVRASRRIATRSRRSARRCVGPRRRRRRRTRRARTSGWSRRPRAGRNG